MAMQRDRPYEYVSRETLARLLDCCARTIDDRVKKGALPRSKMVAGLPRWHWPTVRSMIDPEAVASLDAFSEGTRRAAQEAADDRAA